MFEYKNSNLSPRFWGLYYVVLFVILGTIGLVYGPRLALKYTGDSQGLLHKWWVQSHSQVQPQPQQQH